MRRFPFKLTIRLLMVLILLTALWLFIFIESDAYRRRFPGGSSYSVPSSTKP